MNLSTEKAKELAQNPKFMEELSSVINDEAKCLDLFKKYETELSKEEYQELLKFKKQAELLTEKELKDISGGKKTVIVVEEKEEPMLSLQDLTDGEGIAVGGAVAALGIAIATAFAIRKFSK